MIKRKEYESALTEYKALIEIFFACKQEGLDFHEFLAKNWEPCEDFYNLVNDPKFITFLLSKNGIVYVSKC